MKTNQLFRHVLIIYTSACASRTPVNTGDTIKDSPVTAKFTPASAKFASARDSFAVGKTIDPVICRSDPSQSYALYIPEKGNQGALPVIYLFDPHGAGALPLNKYRSLADVYGFILVGSNNSKNGNDWTVTAGICQHLFDDTKGRLKIDSNRIYTGGFSGGAKVAGYAALQRPEVKGVIANGAGLPDGTPVGDFNFGFTAIVGEGDMNMTDLVAFSKELDNTRTRHHLILFDGKHEWAPVNSMDMAFAGLQFDAMRRSLIPKDESFIDSYITKSKKRLDSYYKTAQLIKAAQESQLSISYLEGLTGEVGWFKEKIVSLAANTLYQKQLQTQEGLLVREQNTKSEYSQHFQQMDRQYWVSTINDLQAKARVGTAESGMYQRLLAYLSLAFYSFSNQLISRNDNEAARYFVELYKMDDPTNSEAWYFSAILDARAGHSQDTENDLLKAAGYGFREEGRMMRQPEFQSLSPQIEFPKVQNRMH